MKTETLTTINFDKTKTIKGGCIMSKTKKQIMKSGLLMMIVAVLVCFTSSFANAGIVIGKSPKPVACSLSNALDISTFNFTTGGDASWFCDYSQYLQTSNNNDSARSGSIGHGKSTWLRTTVIGPTNVGFYWMTKSEYGHDRLSFLIDGKQQDTISGYTGWQHVKYFIPSGAHTLEWRYTKDLNGISYGADRAYVDKVYGGYPVQLRVISGWVKDRMGEPWGLGGTQMRVINSISYRARVPSPCDTTSLPASYSCEVPYDWTGYIYPYKNGYSFNPTSLYHPNVISNKTGQDYSGYIPTPPPSCSYCY